ncbi:MAG: hypothetical protein OCC45_10880 [Desulfotalea sp.]
MKSIKPTNNKDQKKSSLENDRRIGLLSTAQQIDRAVQTSQCPSSEEISMVIGSERAENKPVMEHILVCENCYQEWLILSQEHSEKGIKKEPVKIINLFTNRRKLAATGSAMAIAASIAIFLVIPHDQVLEVTTPQKAESVFMMDNVETQSVEENNASFKQEEKAAQLAVAPPVVTKRIAAEKEAVRNSVGTSQAKRKMAKRPSVKADMETIEIAKDTSVLLENRNDETEINEKTIETLVEFKEQLSALCLQKKIDSQAIKYLLEDGEKLTGEESNLTKDEQEKLEVILSYLKSYSDSEQLCKKVLSID